MRSPYCALGGAMEPCLFWQGESRDLLQKSSQGDLRAELVGEGRKWAIT